MRSDRRSELHGALRARRGGETKRWSLRQGVTMRVQVSQPYRTTEFFIFCPKSATDGQHSIDVIEKMTASPKRSVHYVARESGAFRTVTNARCLAKQSWPVANLNAATDDFRVLTCYGTKIVLQWLKEGKLMINKISQLGPMDLSTNSRYCRRLPTSHPDFPTYFYSPLCKASGRAVLALFRKH
ncbi:hypothetical protein ANN_02182 [Periplaneta americana]|uniref:Uncharacterized protein n=1 Tax=Periplaneta americana TaxID=6978 RepID=A0ABQ8TYJ2_PERAM|nr:hypothetical protein ANN_02182 [Periplaneta americana]